MSNDGWAAIWIYLAGCLTGAALTGWSPTWLERWSQRRLEHQEHKKSERLKALVVEQARKIKERQGQSGAHE